jgi:uncharacterized protein (TIGR00369 family)
MVLELARGGEVPRPFDTTPMGVALGARFLEVTASGRVTMDFAPGPEFVQGAGVVQGGAVSAMLDFALGLCVFPLLPDGMTLATTTLNVSFLRAARCGRLTVVATADRVGCRAGFSSASMRDEGERLIATAMSTVAIIEMTDGQGGQ